MDLEVMKSYLVKVGFTVDSNDFNKFQGSIKSVEELITKHTGSMTKKFVEAGGAIVSAYAAVGTAAITLMDKVASADMGYQLYAMRMYMSVDAAKKLKIATDALGYSLDEIAWNPELRERLKELYRIQGVMEKGLGPGFKDSMKGIRDFQAEWQKLKVEAGYISQSLASSIFKAFGGDGDLLTKLKGWTEWIANHIPEITKKISQYLVPILKDAWEIFKNIGKAVRDVVFVLGELTGDLLGGKKMDKATNQYEKLAIAMKNISGFVKEATSHLKHFTQVFMVLAGIMVGKAAGAAIMALGAAMANPAVVAAGAAIFIAGGVVGGGVGLHYAKTLDRIGNENSNAEWMQGTATFAEKRQKDPLSSSQRKGQGWQKLWNNVSQPRLQEKGDTLGQPSASGLPNKLGWSPLVLDTWKAIIGYESNWKTNAVSKTGADGLGQLTNIAIKEIQKQYGVKINRHDPNSNLTGSMLYFDHLYKMFHGNMEKAVSAYSSIGPGGVKRGGYSLGYYNKVQDRKIYDRSHPANAVSSSIHIGAININGGKDSAKTIADSVAKKIAELGKLTTSRQIAQARGPFSDSSAFAY